MEYKPGSSGLMSLSQQGQSRKRSTLSRTPPPRENRCMSNAKQPLSESKQLWRAAQASRRDVVPEMQVIERRASFRSPLLWLALGVLVGLGVGRSHGAAAQPRPVPPNTPQVIVMAVSYTPTATLAPTVTPTPAPTLTSTPSPTAHPTATPSPTPILSPTSIPPLLVKIIARALNVRAGPGLDYAIIGYASQDQRYRLRGRSGDGRWLRIDFSGLEGWVSVGWVEVDGRVKSPTPERTLHE